MSDERGVEFMTNKESLNKLLNPVEQNDIHSLYEKIMTGNAAAKGSDDERPLYIRAAESRASALGISSEQLLTTYSERLRSSDYPTPDCLNPDEIQLYTGGSELDQEQKEHVSACAPCRNLLQAAKPSQEVVDSLMEDVRLLAIRVSGHARSVTNCVATETAEVTPETRSMTASARTFK
jgi:hypothetical protein